MATTQLQLRRGNKAQNDAFSGAEGELTVDIETMNLRLHSGDETKFGGTEIPKRSDVVSATGNIAQTVTGVKTFSSEPIFTSANLNLKHTNVTKGTAPSSNQYWGVEATANPASSSDTSWQGKRLGKLEWCLNTNNATVVTLSAVKNEAASTTSSNITLQYDATNDIATATAPVPANDTSTSYNRIVTTNWVNKANSGTTYYNNLVHINGTETISGSKTFSTQIIASGGVKGTATSALWADLAENYKSDKKYPIGTLIRFGGKKDITIADIECNGVISEKPGFLLDSELDDSLPVALVGKTKIRVIGKIHKFDKLVLSNIPGVAKEQTTSDEKVIAIALEDSDNSEEKLLLSVVKIDF